jgi:hypothetical protein
VRENKIYLFKKYNFSPYVENEKFHLDSFVKYEEYPGLFSDFKKHFDRINNKIELKYFKEDFNFPSKNFIFQSPSRLYFNLFIKAIILDKILIENQNSKIIVDVYDEETIVKGRFFNLYGFLAKNIGNPFELRKLGCSNVEYVHDPSTKNKIISLFNFKPTYLIYRILKNNNLLFYNKTYLKIGDNYLTRDIEYSLWLKGFKPIEIKNELLNYSNQTFSENESLNEIKFNQLIEDEIKIFLSKKIQSHRIINGLINSISTLFELEIIEILKYKIIYRKFFENKILKSKATFCLTSGLFGNSGKSIYDSLFYNKIKVFSTEHGIGYSFSKDSSSQIFENESLTSDYLFCYNGSSKSSRENNQNSNLKLIDVGAHSVVKFNLFNSLLRLYFRFILKLKSTTIFYISHNIELNSEKYFPYTKPCFQIFNDEKNLLHTLSKTNKSIIYKPYPSKKYLSDRFFPNKYSNIKTLNTEEDFRYIRHASDIIITQASESTLEWCISTNKPLVFLDSEYYEPLKDNKTIEVFKKCFFFFNYDKQGWEQDLIKFLNRPYKDILSDWEEKQKYRNQYDEEYFLSKKKEAGKIASKTILSSI